MTIAARFGWGCLSLSLCGLLSCKADEPIAAPLKLDARVSLREEESRTTTNDVTIGLRITEHARGGSGEGCFATYALKLERDGRVTEVEVRDPMVEGLFADDLVYQFVSPDKGSPQVSLFKRDPGRERLTDRQLDALVGAVATAAGCTKKPSSDHVTSVYDGAVEYGYPWDCAPRAGRYSAEVFIGGKRRTLPTP